MSKPDPISLAQVCFHLEVGVRSAIPSPGMAIYDNFNVIDTSRSRRIEERRSSALDIRVEAAEVAAARPHPEHANNNDEANHGSFIGNYSKSLRHDSLGDPDPKSYGTLLRALQSEDPADFEEIELASATAVKLTNPQSGLAFDIAGPDPRERTMKPAPRFDSEQTAHEMGELYWMALARDIPFFNWATQAATAGTVIERAIESLNSELPLGHATGSGACVTILKAFFDESKTIENPLQPSADGLSLVPYSGTDLTVGGELNKLAGNIAIFRNAAGVHWRSDYTESLPFGEAIAIRLLQEMSLGFNDDDAFFELTKLDGRKIRIFDGKVVPVG